MDDFLVSFYINIFDPERLPVAIVAILIVLIFGMFKSPLGGNTTPILWHIIDKLFGSLGDRMDKQGRLRGDLIFRGFLLTAMTLSIFFLFGRFLSVLAENYSYYRITEIFFLSLCLSSGTSVFALTKLYKALNNKSVDKDSYFRIARSTRTDLSKSDDYSITRVAMGMMVKTFDKAIVSPVIWYLIFGLTGAFVYAAVAALAWRFGKDGHSRGFGLLPVALERLLGFVPNVLAGFLVAVSAAFTPTAGFFSAFKGWFVDKGRAPYEEGGYPITSAAWGLKISLGGPTQDLDGKIIKRLWVGPPKSTARLDALHLHRVLYVILIAHIMLIASLSWAMIFGQSELIAGIWINIGEIIANIVASVLDFLQ